MDWRVRYCDELLEPDRMIAAYSGVRSDVQNGGYHQYSSGDLWRDLLRLLELGGDSEGEAHFRKVLTCFPDSSPAMNRDQRELQLDDLHDASSEGEFTDPFEELDAQYDEYFYPNKETLFKALRARDNVEDFIPNLDEI